MSPPGDRREPPADTKYPPAAAAEASEARLYLIKNKENYLNYFAFPMGCISQFICNVDHIFHCPVKNIFYLNKRISYPGHILWIYF